jgi:hypothetical protein
VPVRSDAIESGASLFHAWRPPAPTLTLILYGVGPDVAAECTALATELHIGRSEVKHLQAACIALKAHPHAFLVAGVSIRPWDRAVLEEHAARAGTPLRWVTTESEAEDVAALVRTWATESARRSRGLR